MMCGSLVSRLCGARMAGQFPKYQAEAAGTAMRHCCAGDGKQESYRPVVACWLASDHITYLVVLSAAACHGVPHTWGVRPG